MRIHLVTAESPESRRLRGWRLIQFPQLTMPLIAALTPPEHDVHHTDELVEQVRFDRPADLVGITAPTPSALHAYALADEWRRRRVPVVIGGPHATALPEEAVQHADAVVVGEAEDTWPRLLEDAAADRAVVFWDDNIGANLRYSKQLFRALAPLGKWWTSQCTALAAREPEFLRLAAASGCKALFLGLESISQASLDTANKGHNRVADYRDLIRSFHHNGVAAHLGIMFGFDQDDPGIFRRTVEFLDEACVDVATMSMVVPKPGTPTFRRWQAEGRILTTDWSRYDGKKHCVFRPARMSPEALVAGTEWASRQFYSLRSIARRLWGSGTGVWWNLPRNLGYHLALRQYPDPGYDPGALAEVAVAHHSQMPLRDTLDIISEAQP